MRTVAVDSDVVAMHERPGWTRPPLGDLCEFIRGVTFDKGEASPDPRDGCLPILRAGNISEGLDLDNDLIWVPAERVSPQQHLRVGDIAICMSSGSPAVVGKSATLLKAFRGSVGAFCGIIRPRDPSWSQYIALWLRSPMFMDWRDGQARGANIQNLRFSQFESVAVPTPPDHERDAFVNRLRSQLATAAPIRAAAEAQMRAIEMLFRAAVRGLFEGDETGDYRRVPLQSIVSKVGSGLTPRGGQAAYVESGVPLIRSQNVRMNRFEDDGLVFISSAQDREMPGTRVLPGDILLNITGASIGRVCLVPDRICPANVNQHVSIIRADNQVEPRFLCYYLSSPGFQSWMMETQAGATRQALTKAQILDFQVPLPSTVQQRTIADDLDRRWNSTEAVRTMLGQQAAVTCRLPTAFLRRAFSGGL